MKKIRFVNTTKKESRRVFLGQMAAVSVAGALSWQGRLGFADSLDEKKRFEKIKRHIKKIVVVYLENRSFNNLFPEFPGLLQPLSSLRPEHYQQRDRDGSLLPFLPPIFGGLVPSEQVKNKQILPGSQSSSAQRQQRRENAPFFLSTESNNPKPLPLNVVTRDLCHLFYHNQMQINKGKNDQFAAWSDAGGLVMGHYANAPAELKLHELARKYTLCDRFFMAAFGGSFLNHQFLIAAQPPVYLGVTSSPAKGLVAQLQDGPLGFKLKLADNCPGSACDGPPRFAGPSNLTPDGFAVNTMAPPYQPSLVPPGKNDPLTHADATQPNVLPPQNHATIGDLLSDKNIDWAWYAGGWGDALNKRNSEAARFFQCHHQPFHYFSRFAPGTKMREHHLKDAGSGNDVATNFFLRDAAAGKLPAVTFYKPEGSLNLHAGYADVASGDAHVFRVIEALEKSPDWQHTAVFVTFDENGGWWDHVAPPEGDRWGPGSRIPALVISPLAKKTFVDHTYYDTLSILKFISKVHELPILPGIVTRDESFLKAHRQPPGDLSHCFDV